MIIHTLFVNLLWSLFLLLHYTSDYNQYVSLEGLQIRNEEVTRKLSGLRSDRPCYHVRTRWTLILTFTFNFRQAVVMTHTDTN